MSPQTPPDQTPPETRTAVQEVAFVAEVSKWVDQHLAGHRGLPFARSGIEGQTATSATRRDFTLRDDAGRPVLTGEVKLPFARDGRTPHATAVVRDARGKARRAGAGWFFTWNVNRFVLWETDPPNRAPADAPPGHPAADPFRAWDLPGVTVTKAADLDSPLVQDRIQNWLPVFLEEFARIYRGTEDLDRRTPDERFVDQLEAALDAPIRLTVGELAARYRKKSEAARLNRWMREDLGWTVSKDERDLPALLDRAARFSCYVLVNRLVFYEALLKRYGAQLARLDAPPHIDTGERLRTHLEAAFHDARRVTRDYETVFGDDPANVGNRVPFYSDAAVDAWRDLIADVHRFDFSKLDYDVIGTLFERLIDPEERRRYGQYYTRPEVVDLLNSFAIRTPDAAVMDPACGGGTFLVRAYARKRELARAAGGRSHADLLGGLYGVDVSHFAAHLTTINLATRDLIEDENYPRVARGDFFDVAPGSRFMDLPAALDAGGLGTGQHRTVEIPPLDAVVGNPPYVRQEDVPKASKTKYRCLAADYGAKLNARSDLHAYFWPHAAAFLKDDGWLCLLTASQWLDTEYGFKLQEWILRHFTVEAVFESPAEPWFVGARVVTTATVLRREPDEAARMTHRAKFVQLRVPLADLLTHDGTNAGAVQAADEFRDEIEALADSALTDGYRARVVVQGDIWRDGVRLGEASAKPDAASSTHTHTHTDTHTHTHTEIQSGRYAGGKWGVPLRAPDLWFELVDRLGDRLVPFGTVANIWFGVKSGCDKFFFPKDVSEACLNEIADPAEFAATYHGADRAAAAAGRVRIVACGEGRGERRPIEAAYLEPEVHSLMEVGGFTVAPGDCSRMILQVTDPPPGSHVAAYIEWGEAEGYHAGSTCAARETKIRGWYDLTGHERGALFWPMAQQYKHAIPANDHDLICNHNLFDVAPLDGDDADVLAGVLNSSVVALSKHLYGRPVGNEGNLKTEVVDVRMMPVPDPRAGTTAQRKKVAAAFRAMKGRPALQFLSERRLRRKTLTAKGKADQLNRLPDETELDQPDRRALDDAVFALLGVAKKTDRDDLIDRLYAHLRDFFEGVRRKEEAAAENKKRAARKTADAGDLAKQVFEELNETTPALLKRWDPDFAPPAAHADAYVVPPAGEPRAVHDELYQGCGVALVEGTREVDRLATRHRAQDALLVALIRSGVRGPVRVPVEPADCDRLRAKWEKRAAAREAAVAALIAERTGDEALQTRVRDRLAPLLTRGPG